MASQQHPLQWLRQDWSGDLVPVAKLAGKNMNLIPKRFIGEVITVEFDQKPATRKNPHCPDRFIWNAEVHEIDALLEERRDHARRGRMTRNMRAAHLTRAGQRGSWGVGRIHFRVRLQDGRFFDLYYDRSPQGGNPLGQWNLYRELAPE